MLFNNFEKQILDAKAAAEKAMAEAAALEEGKTISKGNKTSNDEARDFRSRFASISYKGRASRSKDSRSKSDPAAKDPTTTADSSEDADKKLQSKSDISGEIAVLKEIKDIRDELNILLRILEEQKSITDELFSQGNKLRMNPGIQEYYAEKSGLHRRIQDVKKMDQDAGRTYLHVSFIYSCGLMSIFDLVTTMSVNIAECERFKEERYADASYHRSTTSSTSNKNKRTSTRRLPEQNKARLLRIKPV